MLEIQKTRSSVAHPMSNGQCERFNRTMLQMIKAYLKGEQRDWDKHLGCLAGAYCSTVQKSTGLTPNMMMLGREVQTVTDLICGVHQQVTTPIGSEYVMALHNKMQVAYDIAQVHLGKSAQRNKELYDVHLNNQEY